MQFQIDDAENEWTWAKDTFDLIHIRHLNGSIKDWSAFLKQVYKWVAVISISNHLESKIPVEG